MPKNRRRRKIFFSILSFDGSLRWGRLRRRPHDTRRNMRRDRGQIRPMISLWRKRLTGDFPANDPSATALPEFGSLFPVNCPQAKRALACTQGDRLEMGPGNGLV